MKGLGQVKRILFCACVAVAVGTVSAYVGSRISLRIQRQRCQAQPWGLETVCYAWAAPGAVWQGGTTGFYIGTLLGGILGILGTAKISSKQITIKNDKNELTELELFASEIELNATQKAALKRFLILAILRIATCDRTDSETEGVTLSAEEVEQLFATAEHKQLLEQQLTQEQLNQLLAEITAFAQNRQLNY